VVELAVCTAKKIVERELTSGTANLSEVIKLALRNIPAAVGIKIKVHPEDRITLDEFKDKWSKEHPNEQVEILGDLAVTKGGCFVETHLGLIDASLETRWEQLQKTIWENDRGDTP
jgi:flagellar assembly protein FliH